MVILQLLPELNFGGVERGAVEIARGLVARGHRAIVVSGGGRLVSALERAGAVHVTMPIHVKSPLALLQQVAPLARLIEREHVQVVHARSRMPAVVGWLAARRAGVPFVTTCHGLYTPHPISRVMGWGKLVIVPSETIARHMRRAFGVPHERLRLIPRGVDLEKFRPPSTVHRPQISEIEPRTQDTRHKTQVVVVAQDPNSRLASCALRSSCDAAVDLETQDKQCHGARANSVRPFVVGLIGRLAPIKGHVDFLKAMVTVVSRHPEARAWIIGDAAPGRERYRHELEALIRRLELTETVTLMAGRADIETLLPSLDLAVVPSRRAEAFGRGVIEAWACGVPVVATRVGGLVDIVEDGQAGRLVAPGRPDELAEAIAAMIERPDMARRQAEVGHRLVQERYGLDRMVEATIRVYEETVRGRRVLVIKLSALGDVLLATPTWRELRHAYPQGHIAALTSPAFAPILLRCPHVDEVITYDRRERDRGPAGLWRIGAQLRRQAFDVVVDLQNNRVSRWLSVLSAAPVRAGFRRGFWNGLLSHPVRLTPDLRAPVAQQFRLLERIGVRPQSSHLEFWIRSEEEARIAAFLEANWLAPTETLAGVHVGGSQRWRTKRWDPARFGAVCDRLARQGVRTVLVGGPSERETAERLLQRVQSRPINAVGRTTLGELAALLRRCDVLVAADSAPLHLAAAVGTPVVALFGPTDPSRHLPSGARVQVLFKDLPCSPCYRPTCEHVSCLRQIRVEEVLMAVQHLLVSTGRWPGTPVAAVIGGEAAA